MDNLRVVKPTASIPIVVPKEALSASTLARQLRSGRVPAEPLRELGLRVTTRSASSLPRRDRGRRYECELYSPARGAPPRARCAQRSRRDRADRSRWTTATRRTEPRASAGRGGRERGEGRPQCA